MPSFELRWYGDQLEKRVKDAQDTVLQRAAEETIKIAQGLILANGQVDTGFMQASGYVVGPKGSGYGAAAAAALTHTLSAKSGRHVSHLGDVAAPASAGQDEAVAAFAAVYAAFQETRRAFLYPAQEQVDLDAIIQEAGFD